MKAFVVSSSGSESIDIKEVVVAFFSPSLKTEAFHREP
jgi:hypothetical protein